jgi:mannose-6-phosphate isomerase-like protein (cupin superfamily)
MADPTANSEGMDMRKIVVSADHDGRSGVESMEELTPERRINLAYWMPSDAEGLATPRGAAEILDLDVLPGHARWLLAFLPPNTETPVHRTHTIDFDVILAGNPVLVLERESVELHPGDCVVVNAVDHAWRMQDDGCTLACVVLGIGSD